MRLPDSIVARINLTIEIDVAVLDCSRTVRGDDDGRP
jgi:hypothetical protein